MSMKCAVRFIAFLLMGFFGVELHAEGESRIIPEAVKRCFERKEIRGQVKLGFKINPYYLRGDFDGDGNIDLAISIVGAKSSRIGILVCHASGYVVVLRGDNKPVKTFSEMADDNFISGNWTVMEKSDVTRRMNKMKAKYRVLGEAIFMPWDDGDSMILWDGSKFQWVKLRPLD